MNKIIAIPFFLIVLNFNAQKDFISKYNIKDFVSNNIELIENLNPKKIEDRIKFKKKLLQHRLKNNGIIANYLFKTRLGYELKKTMSNNKNFIKIRNRNIISGGIGLIAIASSVVAFSKEPLFGFLVSILFIYPSAIVLAIIPKIGSGKIRAQLLKDYFLSI
jgi:hypothetical protein